ncbi:MAG: nitrilase family protein, partial [Muribaculaceae bacterium]|nr:nitrilase family protein [Muribaculaceae bacterium]
MNNKEILNIAAIQLDITWGNIEVNLTAAKTFIDNLPDDTDIAILPEMFSTGFICDKTQAIALAETSEGITISTIRQWAQERDFAICGSFIAQEGECIFNRAFFILPSGDATFYDKHHLFSMSGEDSIY